MILTIEQIERYIKEPANISGLKDACDLYDKMNMLINGKDVVKFLAHKQDFENEDQFKARIDRARSTKDIFGNALSPVDKVFSAKGTVIKYDLDEKKESEFVEYLSKIRNNISLRKWIEENWLRKLHYDPNGLIFVEVDESGEKPYPTYKNIKSIYDIGVSGQYVDYVIFTPYECKDQNGDPIKLYRVVDDEYDYTIRVNNDESIQVVEELEIDGKTFKTIPNPHGKVPAIIIGDIKDPNKHIAVTPIDNSVEIGMEYVEDYSIHSIHKFLHGFPLYWEYERQCEVCKGTGQIDGNPCSYCRGTGVKIRKDVSEKMTLPHPEEGETAIAPNVAGVIEPAITTWQEFRTELEWLQMGIEQAIWGTHRNENAENETATARFLDVQPVYEKLNKYSDSLEVIYEFVVDVCGKYKYGDAYGGSSVNFGRRFNIENPDAILKKYTDARTSGSPIIVLNHILDEYVQNEFSRDGIEQTKKTKLLDIEPWKHYTITEVTAFNLPPEEYNKKIYFDEWVSTLTDDDILDTDKTVLYNEFINYVKQKPIKNEEVQ